MPDVGFALQNKTRAAPPAYNILNSMCYNIILDFEGHSNIRKVVSKASSAAWFGLLHGEIDWDPDEVIGKQIKLLKEHVWSHIIWYDFYEMFKVITKR